MLTLALAGQPCCPLEPCCDTPEGDTNLWAAPNPTLSPGDTPFVWLPGSGPQRSTLTPALSWHRTPAQCLLLSSVAQARSALVTRSLWITCFQAFRNLRDEFHVRRGLCPHLCCLISALHPIGQSPSPFLSHSPSLACLGPSSRDGSRVPSPVVPSLHSRGAGEQPGRYAGRLPALWSHYPRPLRVGSESLWVMRADMVPLVVPCAGTVWSSW